jgi:hypothetical protein
MSKTRKRLAMGACCRQITQAMSKTRQWLAMGAWIDAKHQDMRCEHGLKT